MTVWQAAVLSASVDLAARIDLEGAKEVLAASRNHRFLLLFLLGGIRVCCTEHREAGPVRELLEAAVEDLKLAGASARPILPGRPTHVVRKAPKPRSRPESSLADWFARYGGT